MESLRWCLMRASYSACMVAFHCKSARACLTVLGSDMVSKSIGSNLGWENSNLALVCIAWLLTCLTSTVTALGGITTW